MTEALSDIDDYPSISSEIGMFIGSSLLLALANPKRVRSAGIESLLESKEMKKVFMSEQERLLMETAIAYYRDFSL